MARLIDSWRQAELIRHREHRGRPYLYKVDIVSTEKTPVFVLRRWNVRDVALECPCIVAVVDILQ